MWSYRLCVPSLTDFSAKSIERLVYAGAHHFTWIEVGSENACDGMCERDACVSHVLSPQCEKEMVCVRRFTYPCRTQACVVKKKMSPHVVPSRMSHSNERAMPVWICIKRSRKEDQSNTLPRFLFTLHSCATGSNHGGPRRLIRAIDVAMLRGFSDLFVFDESIFKLKAAISANFDFCWFYFFCCTLVLNRFWLLRANLTQTRMLTISSSNW